jgi:bifunctional NMN adenylyltransferase/nudix hydrolase
MKPVEKKREVGVIIGRFQVHELHDAHKDLIQSVLNRHARVIIFLGCSPIKNTLNNPIDFKHRAAMIKEVFPDVEIFKVDDNRSNEVWSKNLDKMVRDLLPPGQTATLYGSRDSFLNAYSGKIHTCELESEIFVSATQVRKQIMVNYPSSKDYRAGLIAATGMHYPTAFQTVDCAIINFDTNELLLVRKPGETKWRFVGGFSDPTSESLEQDAKREVMEETGVEVDDIKYIGSTKIKDWRFRSGKDCIKTAFFSAKYIFGQPEGADDVEAAKWVSIAKPLDKNDIVEEHHVLVDMFNKSFKYRMNDHLNDLVQKLVASESK